MNPDRHLSSHYDYFLDLVRGDDDGADSHRQFYDEYNAVLDMPAEYYLDTIRTVFQDFRAGQRHLEGGRPAGAPAGHPHQRAADHRGRARRHLGRRSDPRGARPVYRHPEGPAVPLRRRRCRALRHLPPVAAGARRSTPKCGSSSSAIGAAPAPASTPLLPKPAGQTLDRDCRHCTKPDPGGQGAGKTIGKGCQPAPQGDRPIMRAVTDTPLAERLLDALPQTQCTRCGFPDCRGYAEAMAAEVVPLNRCPPGGAEGIVRLAHITGRAPALPLEPCARHTRPRAAWR